MVSMVSGCGIVTMPGQSYRGQLPSLTAEDIAIRDRMTTHVKILAGEIGERNISRKGGESALGFMSGVSIA